MNNEESDTISTYNCFFAHSECYLAETLDPLQGTQEHNNPGDHVTDKELPPDVAKRLYPIGHLQHVIPKTNDSGDMRNKEKQNLAN